MNQELKEKIHYYLPHGLKVLRPDNRTILDIIGWENDETLYTRESNNDRSICGFDGCRPFMRPLSSLTKEIVVEGYNDGKPFVPIKILHSDSYGEFAYSTYGVKNDTDPGHWLSYTSIDCLDLLLKWHFGIGDQNLFDIGEIIRIEG